MMRSLTPRRKYFLKGFEVPEFMIGAGSSLK